MKTIIIKTYIFLIIMSLLNFFDVIQNMNKKIGKILQNSRNKILSKIGYQIYQSAEYHLNKSKKISLAIKIINYAVHILFVTVLYYISMPNFLNNSNYFLLISTLLITNIYQYYYGKYYKNI